MPSFSDLLVTTPAGLYCPAGDFYIDPSRKVERAVITHAHSDHARRGMGRYVCARSGVDVLTHRLGKSIDVASLEYGEVLHIHGVKVSLHPAGHILGSAQVRLEQKGRVAVVTGDYKTTVDSTCARFELQKCDLFVTEATFGLPLYQWSPQEELFRAINRWWKQNQECERTTIVLGWSLGKAQRLLAGLNEQLGPIYLHDAIVPLAELYQAQGVALPDWKRVPERVDPGDRSRALVIAPPTVTGTPWMQRWISPAMGVASGWMALEKGRAQRRSWAGFPLSDHADWPELTSTALATEASEVWVTHGDTAPLVHWLTQRGISAQGI